jgi:lysozyme family protein
MADFSDDFLNAFDHAMHYEVGAFWNPNDPDVQQGLIDTKDQRRKVGYVNIPQDRGGETKYGVAQKANPNVNVRSLDLDGAMDVYFNKYWLRGACDQLPHPIPIIHFDGCVNHGIGRANKFLQQAAGVDADGDIGQMTIDAVNNMDPRQLIENIANIRTDFYNSIVERDPSQAMFLKGWMRRITEVTDFTLSMLQ